ncbi:hypothetical protein F511_31827 [Dorcoceras hygrometricum]|uniref:Uncharacterized protein n=1 Tax=Dorcoceras hygrometricum TaxID=472368 RepID=A0A2Z7DJR6_9LAMI|nr:hypothetical protein F511_31827 [Dorcoceras hygrometricum]
MLNTLSRVSVRESQIQYLCDPQWFRDTASRGPTTIVAPESQFRTCPSDHDSIGYPCMSASGESSTTMHRLLHASGSHPIPPPDDPKYRQSGPRPEPRLLRQPALEALTNSARTDSPHRVGRKRISGDDGLRQRRRTAGGGGLWERGGAASTSIEYPRMSASGESSTTMHRLLHASGSHPIPTPYDPKTNQYNQDLGLIHSTNGNHLESPNEGSSIDHQVTIYLHAQNITMFPTKETWYFASQILVSNSGGLILILTVQSTRNMFRIHSDY